MKNRLTKFLSILTLFSVLSSTLFASPALAQSSLRKGTWWNPTSKEFLTKVDTAAENEIFGERYTYAQVTWIIHSLLAILAGPIASCAASGSTGPALAQCVKTQLEAGNSGAILPLALGIDVFQKSKPASGVDYVAGKLEKFNLVDTSYAQTTPNPVGGFGFNNSLAIVQPIWVGVRDASYSLVIFAILILAFMVMLRAKISAQASISVQSALPRVAIGLIMITFSYAIAGFIVDLAYVAMGLMAGILSSSGLVKTGTQALPIFQALDNATGSLVAYIISFFFALFPLFGISVGAGAVGGSAVLSVSTGGAGLVASVIIILILVVIVVVALVRIFWLQLQTFTKLLMLVIVSPMLMLVGIVRSGTITSWIKNIVGQLTVFVAISVMIMLAHIILYTTSADTLGLNLADISAIIEGATGQKANAFNIEAINTNAASVGFFPGGAGFGFVNVLGIFISFGIIVSIPTMASGARDAMLTGKGNFGFDSAGTATGGVATAGAGYAAHKYGANVDAATEAAANLKGQPGYGAALGRARREKAIQDGIRSVGGIFRK